MDEKHQQTTPGDNVGVYVVHNYQWRRLQQEGEPPEGYENPVRTPLYEMVITQQPIKDTPFADDDPIQARIQTQHNRSRGPYCIIGCSQPGLDTWWYFAARGKDRNKLFFDLKPTLSQYETASETVLTDMFQQLVTPAIGCSHFRVMGTKFINYRNRVLMSSAWTNAGFAFQFIDGNRYMDWKTRDGITSVVCYAREEDIPYGLRPVPEEDKHFFYWKRRLQRLLDKYDYRDGQTVSMLPATDDAVGRDELWNVYSNYFQQMLVMYQSLTPNENVVALLQGLNIDRPREGAYRTIYGVAVVGIDRDLMFFFSRMPTKYPVLFAWCTLKRLLHMISLIG